MRVAGVGGGDQRTERRVDCCSARARLDALSSYQVELNRQERVGKTLLEPEDVLLSIRRSPKAVRLEWVDGPQKGREVIYGGPRTAG